MYIKRATLAAVLAVFSVLWMQIAWAQETTEASEPAPTSEPAESSQVEPAGEPVPTDRTADSAADESDPAAADAADEPDEAVDYQAQIEQAAVIKAQAEAEKAKAEAEKAKAEAEKAKAEAAKAKAELAPPHAAPVTAAGIEADLQGTDAEAEVSPGYHRHDGFYLRLTAGPGIGGYNAESADGDPEIREIEGPIAPFWGGSLHLGGAVRENLIVYADVWGISIFDTAKSYYNQGEMIEGYGGLGLGVGYYIMPSNVFVCGSIGPAFSVWGPKDSYYSYSGADDDDIGLLGVGINFMIGREWWVSDNWGLGVAVNANYAWLGRDDYAVNSGGALLLFTATYN